MRVRYRLRPPLVYRAESLNVNLNTGNPTAFGLRWQAGFCYLCGQILAESHSLFSALSTRSGFRPEVRAQRTTATPRSDQRRFFAPMVSQKIIIDLMASGEALA
jgi:hypothetical protein